MMRVCAVSCGVRVAAGIPHVVEEVIERNEEKHCSSGTGLVHGLVSGIISDWVLMGLRLELSKLRVKGERGYCHQGG